MSWSTCFHSTASSSSWMQIALLDGVRRPGAVVQHRVEVADLAEAVTAEFQRGGHEAQSPLADVERGAPVVIRRRVAIGNHHLRERHPVRDGAVPLAVAVPHGVQRHPLAVVETHPQRPVLPPHQVAVDGERRTLGLGDVQRFEGLPTPGGPDAFGNVAGHVLAHHLGRRGVAAGGERAFVLDAQQLHAVQVDDAVQPAEQPGVRVGAGRGLDPAVRPADPAVPELRRRDRVSVGPGVEEHQVDVGDAAAAQRGDDVGMRAQQLVAFGELVDGEVGLHPRDVFEHLDVVVGQRHHALVGGVGAAVEADHRGAPRWSGPAGLERRQLGLGRFDRLDRREAPAGTPLACSRRSIAAAAANSSSDSGSSGWSIRPRNHTGFELAAVRRRRRAR